MSQGGGSGRCRARTRLAHGTGRACGSNVTGGRRGAGQGEEEARRRRPEADAADDSIPSLTFEDQARQACPPQRLDPVADRDLSLRLAPGDLLLVPAQAAAQHRNRPLLVLGFQPQPHSFASSPPSHPLEHPSLLPARPGGNSRPRRAPTASRARARRPLARPADVEGSQALYLDAPSSIQTRPAEPRPRAR